MANLPIFIDLSFFSITFHFCSKKDTRLLYFFCITCSNSSECSSRKLTNVEGEHCFMLLPCHTFAKFLNHVPYEHYVCAFSFIGPFAKTVLGKCYQPDYYLSK